MAIPKRKQGGCRGRGWQQDPSTTNDTGDGGTENIARGCPQPGWIGRVLRTTMVGPHSCHRERWVSSLLSSALAIFEGSSKRIHIFLGQGDAVNGLNTSQNIPPCFHVDCSQGEFLCSQSTREEHSHKAGDLQRNQFLRSASSKTPKHLIHAGYRRNEASENPNLNI